MNLLLITLVTMVFAVALLFRRGVARAARVTEPSCGGCGYCVRGLQTMTCPECGKDLREVGILTPGSTKPMSAGMRLLIWTLLAALPAFVLAQMASQWITPWQAVTTQQRVIFSHAPKMFATVRVEQEAQEFVWGRRARPQAAVTMQKMRLKLESKNSNRPLDLDLASGESTFTDAAGQKVTRTGPLDANVITEWLGAHGLTDPVVADRAADIATAIAEMNTPAGRGFTRLAPNPARGNIADITAHPTSSPFTIYRPTRFGTAVPYAIAFLIWLIGVPFVLLLGRRVQSRGADADQA